MTQTPIQTQNGSSNLMSIDELVELLKPGMAVRGLFGDTNSKVAVGRLNESDAKDEIYRFNATPLAVANASHDDFINKMLQSRYEVKRLTEESQRDEVWYLIR